MDYFPYGKILRQFIKTPEKYVTTGHERDVETGLDYRGARYYDSDVARFLSLDPLAAEFAEWSAYNYVLGNPVMLVDSDGKAPEGDFYNLQGEHLGSDGKKDNRVYVLAPLTKTNDARYKSYKTNDGEAATNLFVGVDITNDELNIASTLLTIRKVENHSSTTPLGYDAQYGGGTFDNDYADHPREKITKWGHTSSAAGAYQFLQGTWDAHSKTLGLTDFSPESQDKAAIYEISIVKGAMENIKSGQYTEALKLLNGKWTSLPAGKQEWKSNVNDVFLESRASIIQNNLN
ncbi:MAG: glycoside hydrolase family protein [Saprospiraceae bacterium]|nr:glycoside hydrolase family protein [Saprospiraceae bacterium]